MKKTVTWIVVADHQHARLYVNDGPGHGVQPLDDIEMDTVLKPSRDIDAHQPDTGFSARNGVHHGYEPKTDAHEKAGRDFLKDVVDAVGAAKGRGAFDRLILVAPPRALGELRQMLPDALGQSVAGEVDKDLTKASADDIAKHLESVLDV